MTKSLKVLPNKVFRFIQQTLHIRTGNRQEAQGRINNQFLITGFSITTIFDFCRRAIESRNTRSLR
ncbi:MAG: hypothetical protein EWV91_00020 [Microcystis aeruginosa Ma_QC_Ca_00000000_S207]|uniref:Uncharacterized protein n=1 Tax=Microcystis aeruginosa Ma_QC_Ca_00000000_S207 TaxID=2486251 RepID=A0A552G6C2_MICAE|nr:MAG: hypothetical protein EWV91_00020 [Microcystis aeruginosa Ma_QC_Ca_00000000_S207]